MKHLYDWASGDPGAPSRQLHKRFKSAARRPPVEVEEKPLYFMEMGNYWTPLDPYPLAVNPLGWRVDTPDGKPWSSKGRVDVQASPQMCGTKKGLPMNVAYGTLHNQGLFFLIFNNMQIISIVLVYTTYNDTLYFVHQLMLQLPSQRLVNGEIEMIRVF
jgi:hypothetical protein